MSDDATWVFLQLDEKQARRSGMPMQVPIKKKDADLVAEGGLTAAIARTSIAAFQHEVPPSWRAQNAGLAARFDAYVGKAMYTDRADAAIKKDDPAATIAALSMVARLDKEDHGARMNLAVAYAKKGELAAALKELVAVETTFEGDADYHNMRGQVLLSSEDLDGALEQYVLALEANPESKAALEALVKMGALVAVYEDPRDATSLVYLRSDAMAEHLLATWTEAKSTAVQLAEQLAYHESESRHEVALAAASAVLAAPDATDTQREHAEAARIASLRSSGKHAEAMVEARAFVARKDASAAAHVELARCLLHASDPEAARAELDRALELDPGDALGLHLRFWPADANDLVAVHGVLPAIGAFVEKHPTSAGAKRSLARAQLVVGQLDGALATFAEAVALDPDNDDLRAELWGELSKAGRDADVVADGERIGGMARRSWILRWNEAEAYARLGKKTEAHAAFAALTNDSELPAAIRKRARRAAGRVAEG